MNNESAESGKKSDIIIGLMFAIFGALYTLKAFTIRPSSVGSKWGHIYFPVMIGVVMVIAGAVLAIKEYKAFTAKSKTESAAETTGKEQKGYSLIIITIILGLAYSFLFTRMGYIASTILFLAVLLFILRGKEKWLSNLLIPVIFSIVVNLFFANLLSVYLP